MTEPAAGGTGAGRRFVINMVGAVGLVFGFIPMLRYLLDLDLFAFTVAPYEWLELEGAARLLPPAMVLVAALVVAYVLERGAPKT
ncbi:hypothetical protein OO014_02240 [Intrasporangium calvum]|uniref:Uncharacterized protein n=1 Tax=Intrasporangium calvum TaxID=53358 RepID=A0ABT5GEE6_9MICO|nr:hypothetical protein [Intrasporangium calvum]MDC5696061.1 hypothetical protein [Intrasporangium calvum]